MGSGIGYQSPCKRYDRPEIACWGFGCANMSVGKKLRELRGSRTQDEISKELGITKSSYAMYERDERVPRDEVKVRISNFFGVSVQELFFN